MGCFVRPWCVPNDVDVGLRSRNSAATVGAVLRVRRHCVKSRLSTGFAPTFRKGVCRDVVTLATSGKEYRLDLLGRRLQISDLSSNALDSYAAPPTRLGPMLDLNDLFYFVQIVERGGFTAAGRSLGMPKSTLSYRMQQLEAALGVRLLNRTSRHFGPTQAGEEFYRHALLMVRAAEEAESHARQSVTELAGVVRFTAAMGTAQFALRDIIMRFMQEYPRVDLVEYVTSRQVDLLAENFDVAIRAHSGELPDSTLVRRTLAVAPWILVAGSEYLKRAGSPETPQDLKRFPCVLVWRANRTAAWHLRRHSTSRRGGRSELIQPPAPRLVSNDMSSLKRAAIEGVGIVALPAYVCKSELRTGELTQVLRGWFADESTFSALLPYRRGLLPTVRTFVDYLALHLPKYVAS